MSLLPESVVADPPMNSDNKPENQDPVLGMKRMRRRTMTDVAPGPDLAGSLCGDSIPSTLYPEIRCMFSVSQ
jgi:hypothetical protein